MIRNANRIKKPAVPAVAGSIRRNSAGAVKRPRSRASAQPRITITTAAATRTGVSTPKNRSRSMYATSVRPNRGIRDRQLPLRATGALGGLQGQ